MSQNPDRRLNLSLASAFVLRSHRWWGKPVVVVQADVLWIKDSTDRWCHVALDHVSVVERTRHVGIDCLVFVHRDAVNDNDPCDCTSRVLVALVGLTSRQRQTLGRVLIAEMQRTRISAEAQQALILPQIHLSHG